VAVAVLGHLASCNLVFQSNISGSCSCPRTNLLLNLETWPGIP